MESSAKSSEYKTKDLHEAAYLIAVGSKLARLEREINYFHFVFEDSKKCEELSNSFWSGEATVNAKEFVDAIRSLKDRIFSRGV